MTAVALSGSQNGHPVCIHTPQGFRFKPNYSSLLSRRVLEVLGSNIDQEVDCRDGMFVVSFTAVESHDNLPHHRFLQYQ